MKITVPKSSELKHFINVDAFEIEKRLFLESYFIQLISVHKNLKPVFIATGFDTSEINILLESFIQILESKSNKQIKEPIEKVWIRKEDKVKIIFGFSNGRNRQLEINLNNKLALKDCSVGGLGHTELRAL